MTTRKLITKGQQVHILPQWQDERDSEISFIACEDEIEGDRLTIEAQLGLPINPQQRVDVDMLLEGQCAS